MLLVVLVVADVLPAIGPDKSAEAVHFVVLPFSVVVLAVGPRVSPFTLYFRLFKITLISGSFSPEEFPFPVSFSVFELSDVPKKLELVSDPLELLGAVWPGLGAVSVLEVVLPVPLVLDSILVDVLAGALDNAVPPHS